MIKYLKLNGNKGIIKPIYLNNLGQINIICGKNNSGKSSILESIINQKHSFLGRAIEKDNLDWWKGKFDIQAKRYSTPSPTESVRWFGDYINRKIGKVIYEDEIDDLVKDFGIEFKKDRYLHSYSLGSFEFKLIVKEYLAEHKDKFKAILIPPKRMLETQVAIDFSKNIIAEGQGILNQLFYLSNRSINEQDWKVYTFIQDAFKEVTSGYSFKIIPTAEKNNNICVYFSKDNRNWIEGNSSGLGLRDILVILYFIIDSQYNIILIEEPESHIHPEIQRRLINLLSQHKEKQFYLATHSNVFLDLSYANKIFYVEMKESIEVSDETQKSKILKDLGYSIVDNLVSDLIILTEGPFDVPIIEEICKKLGFWEKYNIKCWSLGGDAMIHTDLSAIKENSNVIAIVDSDPKSRHVRNKFQKNCKDNNIPFYKLRKYSIENYLSIQALKKVFGKQIPENITEIAPNKKMEDQLGFSVKSKNREIISNMDLMELEGTDLIGICKKLEESVKIKETALIYKVRKLKDVH